MAADNVSLANYKVAGLNFCVVPGTRNDTSLTSGIMGLAFESLSDNHVTPFWQVVAAEGKVQDPVFSFELKVNTNQSQANEMVPGGVFTLGTLDSQQYSGEITWMDLDSRYGSKGKGFWGIKMDALSLDGSDVPLGSNNLVLVDTGTSLIGAPPAVAKAFHEQIPNSTLASSAEGEKRDDDFATYYVFPCSEQFEVAFTFGGRAFTLNQDQLNIGSFNKTTSTCVSGFASVVYPTDNQTNAWILGDVFLSEVFSVFSWEPQRVGFASLPKNGPKTLALSSTQSHSATSGATTANGGNGSMSESGPRSLPTPALAEVPSGMGKLSVPSSLPSGTSTASGSQNDAPHQMGRVPIVQATLLAMALIAYALVC
ncbi:cathepsin D [Malassezia furfur]|uniref:Cathepsin D n=1 Tax=Malassezia furfur TaxID=55194 RepID=A0ABY8ETL4_MALFU|nr:cathepsin D [Malassezia furfur]